MLLGLLLLVACTNAAAIEKRDADVVPAALEKRDVDVVPAALEKRDAVPAAEPEIDDAESGPCRSRENCYNGKRSADVVPAALEKRAADVVPAALEKRDAVPAAEPEIDVAEPEPCRARGPCKGK